jgi:alginate O-acetyltransferase complex protein AlgI
MLFNSYEFILLFLPLAVIGYFALARRSSHAAKLFLCALSCIFYMWWKAWFVIVLLASMVINYGIGAHLVRRAKEHSARTLLVAGLIFNIGLLGYFKYADFFISNVNAMLGSNWSLLNIALPLGISFFTFTQIAFLVDAWRGNVTALTPTNYFLFVTYFPHLLAGPIIHHREMMPQFADATLKKMNWDNIARGLVLFTLGLCKKVLIADQIAPWANAGFASVESLSFLDAWITIVSYSMQLAFDFSGYTDMALGAALMMNIRLPQNFNAPFRAPDIQDFWRRWHMTLSRFLRDYIYIPLGGSRAGEWRMCALFIVTFLVGGLWHGAAWTFVLWGALHGTALVILHLWRKSRIALPTPLAIALTFVFVILCFAVFRAASVADAMQIVRIALGFNGISTALQVHAWQWLSTPIAHWQFTQVVALSTLLIAIALSFTRNTAADFAELMPLTLVRASVLGVLLFVALMYLPGATEFIYFIF